MIDAQESHNAALLHAATGAALAQDRFGVCDEVADAIRYHTTGRADMRFLEKILYLADYIEPTRDFDGVDTLRHLASQPHLDALDTALETALDMSILHILSQQKSTRRRGKRAAPNAQNAPDPVHPRTRQALAFLRQARANNN